MRIFHVSADQFTELSEPPEHLPAAGWLWLGFARAEVESGSALLQSTLRRWTGGELVDLHISDLLNKQLPSHFDSTSWYDLMVFRRLAAGTRTGQPETAMSSTPVAEAIDTSPVGFALFDRVLLSVHPDDCIVRDFFAARLAQQGQFHDTRNAARLPPNPADLMLRMLNHMVDSYLDLRRLLSRELAELQRRLFEPNARPFNWHLLLDLRNALHLLEDTCEDQQSAIVEWIDALDEWPREDEAAARREHELLRVRSRDVQEHVARVLSHVRRLESSAETAVQMHFSAQSHRTNNIMRTLTVLTAIFLPLNLLTGFFGMNFDRLPLIHNPAGIWAVIGLLVSTGVALSVLFWRKRYLGGSR